MGSHGKLGKIILSANFRYIAVKKGGDLEYTLKLLLIFSIAYVG